MGNQNIGHFGLTKLIQNFGLHGGWQPQVDCFFGGVYTTLED